MHKNYRYAINKKKITIRDIKEYNNRYFPHNKKIDCIQDQFDKAVYNGDIKKAVKILINYHFKKLNNVVSKLKLKLVSQF